MAGYAHDNCVGFNFEGERILFMEPSRATVNGYRIHCYYASHLAKTAVFDTKQEFDAFLDEHSGQCLTYEQLKATDIVYMLSERLATPRRKAYDAYVWEHWSRLQALKYSKTVVEGI